MAETNENGRLSNNINSLIVTYLTEADAALKKGQKNLAVHLYLAAYTLASNSSAIPIEQAINGLKKAWSLAYELHERSLAEYIFERMDPYLNSDERKHACKQLQNLALDMLAKFGLPQEALDQVADMMPDSEGLAHILRIGSGPATDNSIFNIEGSSFNLQVPSSLDDFFNHIKQNSSQGLSDIQEANDTSKTGELQFSNQDNTADVNTFKVSPNHNEEEESIANKPSQSSSDTCSYFNVGVAQKQAADSSVTANDNDKGKTNIKSQVTDNSVADNSAATNYAAESKVANNQSVDNHISGNRAAESKVASNHGVNNHVADNRIANSCAENIKVAENKPVDTASAVGNKPADSASPVDNKPADSASADKNQLNEPQKQDNKQNVKGQIVLPAKLVKEELAKKQAPNNIPLFSNLVGFDNAILQMEAFGFNAKRSKEYDSLVSMLNKMHGVQHVPNSDSLLFSSSSREDANQFMEACANETGLPLLKMSMEESVSGAIMLCLSVRADKQPKLDRQRGGFNEPAVLCLQDIDLWMPSDEEMWDSSDFACMQNLSRGAMEALQIIRSSVSDPRVRVFATISSENEYKNYFCDSLSPYQIIPIDKPNYSERKNIWMHLLKHHPSLRQIDLESAIELSSNMSRYDIYSAAHEAVDDAYEAGLMQRKYVAVSNENIFDKIAACHSVESNEYKKVEDRVIKDFQTELKQCSSVDELFSMGETDKSEGSQTQDKLADENNSENDNSEIDSCENDNSENDNGEKGCSQNCNNVNGKSQNDSSENGNGENGSSKNDNSENDNCKNNNNKNGNNENGNSANGNE